MGPTGAGQSSPLAISPRPGHPSVNGRLLTRLPLTLGGFDRGVAHQGLDYDAALPPEVSAEMLKAFKEQAMLDNETLASSVCQELVTQVAIEIVRHLTRGVGGVGPYIGVTLRGLEQRLGQQGDGVFEVWTGPRAGASEQEKEVVATIVLEAKTTNPVAQLSFHIQMALSIDSTKGKRFGIFWAGPYFVIAELVNYRGYKYLLLSELHSAEVTDPTDTATTQPILAIATALMMSSFEGFKIDDPDVATLTNVRRKAAAALALGGTGLPRPSPP
ncbi:BQ5605_C010g06218 [Microbotryum silenes-dioicae]|uniref:BQ5605_C010g06218 protein n=1 Tax=Microbotryum silenes-dioicae TaxID=796604 RepID=A0A2X0LU48_9BASI|nr:BQ5605_C010g06218 [Microbotryum silenes-dioicae]